MAFIPLNNIAQYHNQKEFPKIGKVLDNKDPKKLGRIKVQIDGLLESTDEKGSNLPWIRRLQDNFLSGCGESFSVPEEGSMVEIIWPYDNRNAFYRAIPYGEKSSTEIFADNYPNVWGFTDGKFIFKVDKSKNELTVTNNKVTVIITDSGEVKVTGQQVFVESNSVNVKANSVDIKAGKVNIGGSTTIDNKVFLSHIHSNGNDGRPTGGVI